MTKKKTPEEMWHGILTAEYPIYLKYKHLLRRIPSNDRCKNCNAPFNGIGGLFMRLLAHGPYNKNPHFCNW